MTRLLAIDPGTIAMGLAIFDGPDLVGSRSVAAPARFLAEDRCALMMNELRAMMRISHVTALAIERPGAGNPAHRPATLLTLCTFIRQAAKREWRVPCIEYATGTITAAVRLRGWPGDRKAQLLEGVCALYGEHYRRAPQDVVDAIAIGHCHLCKIREKELEGIQT